MLTTGDLTPSEYSREYELLTKTLIERLSARAASITISIAHNVQLKGKATSHRVDVVWTFISAGTIHRVLFECRRYKARLKQKDVFAFHGVVNDVQEPESLTVGVMVTTTGYQRGALDVAETYGVFVVELREPNEGDLTGRLNKIHISITLRIPEVEDLKFEAAKDYSPTLGESGLVVLGDIELRSTVAGSVRKLADVLLAGELNCLDEPPTPRHPVRREFNPPEVLMIGGVSRALIQAVTANVRESEADPFDFSIGGREKLAYMIRDATGGSRVWFALDGKIYGSDS